jgi:hypothetical protein
MDSIIDEAKMPRPPTLKAWHINIHCRKPTCMDCMVPRISLEGVLDENPGELPIILHCGAFAYQQPRGIEPSMKALKRIVELFGFNNVIEEHRKWVY